MSARSTSHDETRPGSNKPTPDGRGARHTAHGTQHTARGTRHTAWQGAVLRRLAPASQNWLVPLAGATRPAPRPRQVGSRWGSVAKLAHAPEARDGEEAGEVELKVRHDEHTCDAAASNQQPVITRRGCVESTPFPVAAVAHGDARARVCVVVVVVVGLAAGPPSATHRASRLN